MLRIVLSSMDLKLHTSWYQNCFLNCFNLCAFKIESFPADHLPKTQFLGLRGVPLFWLSAAQIVVPTKLLSLSRP